MIRCSLCPLGPFSLAWSHIMIYLWLTHEGTMNWCHFQQWERSYLWLLFSIHGQQVAKFIYTTIVYCNIIHDTNGQCIKAFTTILNRRLDTYSLNMASWMVGIADGQVGRARQDGILCKNYFLSKKSSFLVPDKYATYNRIKEELLPLGF